MKIKDPSILYIDMAYTYKMVIDRGLSQYLKSKEVGGYFSKVWTIHPLSDIPTKRRVKKKGFVLDKYNFSSHHTFLEGQSKYYPIPDALTPLNILISQIRLTIHLIQLFKQERIDFIQTEEPYFGGIIGLVLKLTTGAKLIVAIVANYDEIYSATRLPAFPRLFKFRFFEKFVERIVFRRADLVIAVNENNKSYAIRNGAAESKTLILTFGRYTHRDHQVPPSLRNKDDEFIFDDKIKYFVYIGRMTQLKHPDDVVKAFSLIKKDNSFTRLLMIGDGDFLSYLKQLTSTLGIADSVIFLGNINQTRLARILAGCSVCLSPITGAALIEAGLAGLPIVGYDRDWQASFIVDGIGGFVVPFRNWEAMASKSLCLLEQEEIRVRMGNQSRVHALKLTNLNEIYGKQKTRFDLLLNEQKSRH